jgi:hypothetical protein
VPHFCLLSVEVGFRATPQTVDRQTFHNPVR